jgi:hypothetical protein
MKPSEWAKTITDEWESLSPREVEDTLAADGTTTWWNYDLARAYLRLREDIADIKIAASDERVSQWIDNALEESDETI